VDGATSPLEFLTGYLLEEVAQHWTNLFVFILCSGYFKGPPEQGEIGPVRGIMAR